MAELIILVGLPGAGKTTYAQKLCEAGYKIISCDDIRMEIYHDDRVQDNEELMFDILVRRIKEVLKDGFNCVYDSDNVNRKWREKILQSIDIECHKKAVVMATPVDECIRRDRKRKRSVSSNVIWQYAKNFWIPERYEGFDDVEIIHQGYDSFDLDDIMDFSQDNPHHTLTLGEHMKAAWEYAKNKGFENNIVIAAKYHDCGKAFTKTYVDRMGSKSEIAHYYNHENVSAYIVMCMNNEELGVSKDNQMMIVRLINWHMRPLYWNMGGDKAKDVARFGDDFTQKLLELHEADSNAK